ncbi:carbonic anhydrase [Carnimonas bestiolae]|uniref:carbonic anhydrase n=1 Tax=Carnimonas bestiolae TaxID=3402172 RepID=UPI003EDBB993
MHSIDRILLENAAWASEHHEADPELFARLSSGQAPRVLWIGCSDSRVPAESICNAGPGDIFVFRNIANLVSDQRDAQAVLDYAVMVLKVEHIIVCGHHSCGGIRTALQPHSSGSDCIDAHLASVKTLVKQHADELATLDEQAQVIRLSELSVQAQIDHLLEHPLVRQAMDQGTLTLHGMMYSLHTGRLRELVRKTSEAVKAVPAASSH